MLLPLRQLDSRTVQSYPEALVDSEFILSSFLFGKCSASIAKQAVASTMTRNNVKSSRSKQSADRNQHKHNRTCQLPHALPQNKIPDLHQRMRLCMLCCTLQPSHCGSASHVSQELLHMPQLNLKVVLRKVLQQLDAPAQAGACTAFLWLQRRPMRWLWAIGWQGGRGRPLEPTQEASQSPSRHRQQQEIQAANQDPMQRGLLRDAQLARMHQHADVDAMAAKVSMPHSAPAL